MQPSNQPAAKKIPENYWQLSNVTQHLQTKFFRWHLVGVILRFRPKDSPRTIPIIYTGFLIDYKEQLIWVTAGHVVNAIKKRLNADDEVVEMIGWMDTYTDDPQPAIPWGNRKPRMKSWYQDGNETDNGKGIDVGVVIIKGNDHDLLRANKKLKPYPLENAKHLVDAPANGFYLCGFPRAKYRESETKVDDRQILRKIEVGLYTLPVDLTPRLTSRNAGSFWRRKKAVYGKILPYAGSEEPILLDIKFMSGGPIFAIHKWNEDKNVGYWLAGVQSSWLELSQTNCFEPCDRLIRLLDAWL